MESLLLIQVKDILVIQAILNIKDDEIRYIQQTSFVFLE